MNNFLEIVDNYLFDSDTIKNPDTGKSIKKSGTTFKKLLLKYITADIILDFLVSDKYSDYNGRIHEMLNDIYTKYRIKNNIYDELASKYYKFEQGFDILDIRRLEPSEIKRLMSKSDDDIVLHLVVKFIQTHHTKSNFVRMLDQNLSAYLEVTEFSYTSELIELINTLNREKKQDFNNDFSKLLTILKSAKKVYYKSKSSSPQAARTSPSNRLHMNSVSPDKSTASPTKRSSENSASPDKSTINSICNNKYDKIYYRSFKNKILKYCDKLHKYKIGKSFTDFKTELLKKYDKGKFFELHFLDKRFIIKDFMEKNKNIHTVSIDKLRFINESESKYIDYHRKIANINKLIQELNKQIIDNNMFKPVCDNSVKYIPNSLVPDYSVDINSTKAVKYPYIIGNDYNQYTTNLNKRKEFFHQLGYVVFFMVKNGYGFPFELPDSLLIRLLYKDEDISKEELIMYAFEDCNNTKSLVDTLSLSPSEINELLGEDIENNPEAVIDYFYKKAKEMIKYDDPIVKSFIKGFLSADKGLHSWLSSKNLSVLDLREIFKINEDGSSIITPDRVYDIVLKPNETILPSYSNLIKNKIQKLKDDRIYKSFKRILLNQVKFPLQFAKEQQTRYKKNKYPLDWISFIKSLMKYWTDNEQLQKWSQTMVGYDIEDHEGNKGTKTKNPIYYKFNITPYIDTYDEKVTMIEAHTCGHNLEISSRFSLTYDTDEKLDEALYKALLDEVSNQRGYNKGENNLSPDKNS